MMLKLPSYLLSQLYREALQCNDSNTFFTYYQPKQQLKLISSSLLPLSILHTISNTAFSPFPQHLSRVIRSSDSYPCFCPVHTQNLIFVSSQVIQRSFATGKTQVYTVTCLKLREQLNSLTMYGYPLFVTFPLHSL